MAITDTTRALPLSPGARVDHVFPTLTSAQIARIAAHGTVRSVQAGEVLIEEGRQEVPFFVVKAGQIEIVRRSNAGEAIVAVHRPGQFTGEANLLSNRRSLFRARASEAGEAIELDRKQLLSLV